MSNFLECLALGMWRIPWTFTSEAAPLSKSAQNRQLQRELDNCRGNPSEPLRCLDIKVLTAGVGSDKLSNPLQLELKQWLIIPFAGFNTHETSPSVVLTSVVIRK